MDRKHVKIEGHSNLVRDTESGAVLSRSRSDFEIFKAKANKEKALMDRISSLEARILALEEALSHVK